ncbi:MULTISPECIES: hypothetical protein, partial [unclassified Pseudomonas]|uniref:hypothetical protein n=1 Tax=unclassified Pseudomonas TaxID=196821 RepID=UPI0018E71444
GRYEYRLLRTYLDGLGHGKKLRMEFKAAVSLSKVEAEAISFPVVEYTVNTLPAEFPVPKLTQATGTGTSVTLAPLNAQNGGTVSVEYTPMYTTDSIKVTMVGTAGAGSPVIPAKNGVTAGKVTFDITKAAIAANVGNANKTLTLKYDVTRSGKVVASKVLTVTVTPIPTTELAKTVIRINEADAATKVLDLSGSVTNKTLRVGSWPFIASFQPVAMLLSGFKADGSVHELQVWTLASNAVTAGWFSNGFYDQRVAASYFLELGHDTKLKLQFKATLSSSQAEADAIIFPIVEYTVNTLPAEFPVPKLTQATGTGTSVTLAPLNAQNGGTVSVEYTPMYTTDSIKVTMVGTVGAGSPVIPAKNGVTAGKVTFDITKAAIAANVGNANKTFTLKYDVTRSGKVVASKVLTVTVTPIPAANLRRPLINGVAHTGTLDVPNLPANAKLTIAPWPLQYSGMKIWLLYRCAGANPNPHVIWTGAQHHSADGLEYGAPLTWLKTCPNGATVSVEFKVAYDPNTDEAGAVSFPITQYTVLNVDELIVDTSPVYLSRTTYLIPSHPTVLPVFISGNSIRRSVSGGKPPYYFSSSKPSIAHVDETGRVTSRGNDSAIITVTDSSQPPQSKSYSVTVSNVINCHALAGKATWSATVSNASSRGLRVPDIYELRALSREYGNRWPLGNDLYWSSSLYDLVTSYQYLRNIITGGEIVLKPDISTLALGVVFN